MQDVAIALVWNARGEVLITKRPAGTEMAGYWEFPGGKVEPGETSEAAVARECLEECALEVEPYALCHTCEVERPGRKSLSLVFWHCRLRQLTGQIGAEVLSEASSEVPAEVPAQVPAELSAEVEVQHLGVSDHRWVQPTELTQFKFLPANEPLLPEIREGERIRFDLRNLDKID